MARSIGRTYRLVRLAAIGAALATVALAGGCSAGQEAATSEVVAAVPGGFATATPDASLPLQVVLVENVEIAFKDTAGYPAGGTAPLAMHIFNQTKYPITVAPGDVIVPTGGRQGRRDRRNALLGLHRGARSGRVAVTVAVGLGCSVRSTRRTGASPSATVSAAPTPAAVPTIPPIIIPAGGFVILAPGRTSISRSPI